jgi:segregation and condensation protein A
MSVETLLADDYKVDLEVFEGPLDLLLYLIRREEVDIYDIPIEKITRQYMAYLDMMRMLDLNIAGEFLVMAATLMMIKSRMLLPVESRNTEEESDEDWVDPRLDLVRQLIEYKKFKDAAGFLLEREVLKGEAFAYGGEAPIFEKDPLDAGQALGDIGLFDLLTAFQDVLSRASVEPLGHFEAIRWSVPDKMEMIVGMMRERPHVYFSSLFQAESPRGEIIVTFLALLELLRMHQIVLQQNDSFHEIVILPEATARYDQMMPLLMGGTENAQP